MNIFILAEGEAATLWAQIKEVFDTHKDEAKVHITADAQIFLTENHADGHASRLLQKGIATVTREQIQNGEIPALAIKAPVADGGISHPEADAPTPESIAAKAQADKELQEAVNGAIGTSGAIGSVGIEGDAAEKPAADKAAACPDEVAEPAAEEKKS